jgi:hypothetical protein
MDGTPVARALGAESDLGAARLSRRGLGVFAAGG